MLNDISVVIPAYNSERYVAEAIESALGQSHPPAEIIVIDDGSTDGTAEIVRRFSDRVHYLHQENGGIGNARNRGVQLAQCSFLSFVDSDDAWTKDKLSLQLQLFNSVPELDMVFGHAAQVVTGDAWDNRNANLSRMDLVPAIIPGGILIKRESFFRVGAFRTDTKVGEFIDWYARAIELGLKSRVTPDLVLWRRLHDSNQGIRERASVSDYARVLKASLDRRRAAQRQNGD
jgi:glycosyltransferase involved in cell wall biosynthesis